VTVPEGQIRQPLSALSPVVQKAYPEEAITQIRFKEKANAAVIYYTRSGKAISVDPYTLQVAGVRNLKNDFFDWILDMHRHLRWGKTGSQIIKWNVLIFFMLCITGLIIWWPKQKRFLKQAVTIKFRTKNRKRLNWDLHSVLGFYSLAILLIISLTGIFWMFDWARDTVRFVTNSPAVKEKKIKSAPSSVAVFTMEQAYEKAKSLYSETPTQTFISVNPADSVSAIRVLFRYPYTLSRKQNSVFFDKYSGKVLREDLDKNTSGYDKVARANFDLHTGRIGALGIGSKIIYFLASLFAASLPVTGILIWLGRTKKKKKKPLLQSTVSSKREFEVA
jgi:uncharacterized iron-regulated membrane protein